MKREHGFVVLALGILLVVIIILSIRNDYRFNEELRIKDGETLQRDSLMQGQMDSITILLNDVTFQRKFNIELQFFGR